MKRLAIVLLLAVAAVAEVKVYYWAGPRGMAKTITGNAQHQANMEAQIELYGVREDPNDPNSPIVLVLNQHDPNDPNDDVWHTRVSQDLDPTVDPNTADPNTADPNEAE